MGSYQTRGLSREKNVGVAVGAGKFEPVEITLTWTYYTVKGTGETKPLDRIILGLSLEQAAAVARGIEAVLGRARQAPNLATPDNGDCPF